MRKKILQNKKTSLLVALLGCLTLLNVFGLYQRFSPPPRTPDDIIKDFHLLAYNSGNSWEHSFWFGVPTGQNPLDAWMTQEIINEVKPDYIIEAGTWYGGSALLWAWMLKGINPNGRVITIDIADPKTLLRAGEFKAMERPLFRERVEFLLGSSTDAKIVDAIKRKVAGRKVMVILDSDHHAEHVLAELKAYAPLVPVGSYVIVQDTDINGHPVLPDFGPGPAEAVDKFLDEHAEFKIDLDRERFLFTQNPHGFLRRVQN